MTQFSIAFQTDHSLSAYGPLAAAAEAYGFDGVSVYNDLLYQPSWLPLLEIARHTHRVAIGPASVNPFTCHPINIAGNIALIDEASNGRAYLGLSRGSWLDFLGMQPKQPAVALREAFDCIRHLLRRDVSPYQGRAFKLAGGDSLRWNIARPDVPFLLGSWGPRTIQACIGAVAAIKLGGTTNPALIPHFRQLIADAALAAGRAADSIQLVVGAVTVVDRDGDAARALARRKAGLYMPVIAKLDPTLALDPELLKRVSQADAAHDYEAVARLIPDALLGLLAFAGTPDEIMAQAHSLIAAGVDRIEFGTPHGLSAESGLHLLGDQVLRAFR
jgi:5,10-methylenetetrahydromethanopterin reductase